MRKAQFSRQVTFSMSEASYETIRQISDKASISIADFIRRTIDAALAKREEEESK